ncbi:cytochrome P450 [Mycena maculata]|uniref:Cytochrome P450 n=1 Tax=Mycena maculata TaxID=230809 RepID=A0AAD7MWH1_9AGAR|nr:cytochrome P450 [Mycena maculata]
MRGFAVASEPGRWWVDNFPALKHLPSWFPGASFQLAAQHMQADLDKLFDIPYQFVKREIATGRPHPSFLLSYLEEKNGLETPTEEELTPSALTSFILAMSLNPEVQSRAQDEIDALLVAPNSTQGSIPTRLPTFDDRNELPYISAIVKEVWRWNPSMPLGLPHVATENDEYRGYTIEKGSVMWANVWAILHDDEIFPEPFAFRPERYLSGNDKPGLTVAAVFGFGRSICPGMHLAENSVFIAIATILCMLRISKSVDKQGNVLEPAVEYDGFISRSIAIVCTPLH